MPCLFRQYLIAFFAVWQMSGTSVLSATEANIMCETPFLLEATMVGTHSAFFDWTPLGSEGLWDVAILPHGAPPPGVPTTEDLTESEFMVTGLEPGQRFDFYVRADCGAGQTSDWALLEGVLTDLENPSACQLGLDIPDDDCQIFEILVNYPGGGMLGDNVYLKSVDLILTHEWADDLDIQLTSPNGVVVILSTDNGNGEENYGDPSDMTCSAVTELISSADPSSCNVPSIINVDAPFIGTFLSEGDLSNFNDGSDLNDVWELRICDDVASDVGALEFVQLNFEALTCPPPRMVEALAIDSTSALLSWIAGENCLGTIIEYGPPGFQPGTGATNGVDGILVFTDCPDFTLQNLDPETSYDIYIREQCLDMGFSNNSCPLNIQTTCSPYPATIISNFDGLPTCMPQCDGQCPINEAWYNITGDEMEWIVWNGPTPTNLTGPDDDPEGGGNFIFLESSACSNGDEAILQSNCIDIVGTDNGACHFTFNYMMYGNTIKDLKLEITIDGGQSWIPIWEVSGNLGQEWYLEFISLSAFEGLTVQFRFVGRKGFGTRGDIALDNLVFHGPIDGGFPPHVFYLDQDNDGYGDSDQVVYSCFPEVPMGYAVLGGDCWDLIPEFNPGVEETPCDFFDVNCNGFDDEPLLPAPVVISDTVCTGDPGLLEAAPAFGGIIIWYDEATGGMPLDTGTNFLVAPIPNTTGSPIVLTYYAEEQNIFDCYSPVRGIAQLVVLPEPELEIQVDQFEPQCSGEFINLEQLVIQDLNNTNANYSFHTLLPASTDNIIDPPFITPVGSAFYYVLAEAPGGCSVVDSFWIEVKDSPFIAIEGGGDQCIGVSSTLTTTDYGNGILPFEYQWTTGSTDESIDVIAPGPIGATASYGVTVTAANGCVDADVILVESIGTIENITVDVTDISDCGVEDGIINLVMQGGNAPYEISWSGEQSGNATSNGLSFDLIDLAQGSYFITVTDASFNGCPYLLPITVVNGPSADATINSVSEVTCFGGEDGCIVLDVADPMASIIWSNGASGTENCDLASGDYFASITNGSCSNVVGPINVGTPDSLIIKIATVEDAACFGTFTGAISVLTIGGTAPYDFLWSNDSTTSSITQLPAGDYFLTVTDQLGCEAIAGPIEVAGVPEIEVNINLDHISCFGNNDGRIQLNPAGGTPPYAFNWNTGSNLPGLNNLSPGTYEVTLTDFNACEWEQSFEIIEPTALDVFLVEQVDASCAGVADGTLTIGVNGGIYPYAYDWSVPDQDSIAADLESGLYQVTVSDANGCSFILEGLEVGGIPEVVVEAFIEPTSCQGIADGMLSLDLISGTQPINLEWSNGQTSPSISDLLAGDYTVTLTDGLGCTNIQTFEVPSEQPISYSSSAFPPNCFEGDNGTIFLTVLDGVPPLEYEWNNGAITNDLDNLSAGSYVCTITDAGGCILITDTILLVDPPEIEVILESIDSISCAGDMDAGIDVTITGGQAPYQYTWNNDLTDPDIQGLGPGEYVLTVEDELNCAINGPVISIPEPEPLMVTSMEIDSPIDCSDNILDSVQLIISGGSVPYMVQWSNGDTTSYLTNAGSGEFDVTVTDANGCEVSIIDIKIPNPAPVLSLRLDSTVLFPDDCSNLPDAGDLRVLIEGGYPPYQYNWSHGVQNQTLGDTIEVDGLEEGTYNVTVTDDVGCTEILEDMTILLPEPLNAFIQPGSIVDVSCKYGNDGSVQLNVTGGFPAYSFFWVNSLGDTLATTEDPTGLSAGLIQARVRDQFGCEVITPFVTVDEPDSLLNSIFDIVDIFCFGEETGSIAATVSGGTAPYDLNWSNDSDEVQITNLPAGMYSVTIEDDNNCIIFIDSLEVKGPDSPIMVETAQVGQVSCFGGNNGFVNITVNGGTPGYSYFWNNGSFNQDIFNLEEGSYDCLIIDEKGCDFQTQIYYVGQPPLLEVTDLNITPASLGNADGAVTAIVEGGQGPYDLNWSNGDIGATADSLEAGVYTLEILDANLCPLTLEVTIPLINSVEAVQFDIDFQMIPNPTHDKFWIEGNHRIKAGQRIELIDQFGRVYSRIYQESGVNLEDLPAGAYSIRLFQDKEVLQLGILMLIR